MEAYINLELNNGNETGLVRGFFRRTGRLLLDPRGFFQSDLPAFSLSEALAFGATNAWIAAVLAFFVKTLHGFLLSQLLERWMQRLLASEGSFSLLSLAGDTFLYSAGALLLGPFLFVARAFFSSLALYIFAHILIEEDQVAPEPVTFGGVMRIESAVLVSQWFSIVPIFGGLLSFAVGLVLSVTGIRERFGVSTRRALAVVLAPYLLLFFFLLLLAALVFFALFQLPLNDLLQIDPASLGK